MEEDLKKELLDYNQKNPKGKVLIFEDKILELKSPVLSYLYLRDFAGLKRKEHLLLFFKIFCRYTTHWAYEIIR